LHRTELFHTLNSYPIIFLEGEQTTVVIGSDLDRNHLFPMYPEIDALHMQTLKQLYSLFKSQKWCCVVLPEQAGYESNSSSSQAKDNKSKDRSDISMVTTSLSRKLDLVNVASWLSKRDSLTLVNSLSIWRKGNVKDVDLLTISTSPSGRSHVLHVLHSFTLFPYFCTNSEISGFDMDKCKLVFDKLVDDIKELKALTANGTCIYNPFLAKSRGLNPVVFESHALKPLTGRHYIPSSVSFPDIATVTTTGTVHEQSTSANEPPALPVGTTTTSIASPNLQWHDPGILHSGSPIHTLPVNSQELLHPQQAAPIPTSQSFYEGINVNILASALATVLSFYK